MKKRLLCLILCFVLAFPAAFSVQTQTVSAATSDSTLTLNKTTASIKTGKTVTLKGTISGSTASGLKWSSSNKKVAYVNSNGVVTGISAGTATITAKTSDGKSKATCTVTVTASTSTLKPLSKTISDATIKYNISYVDDTLTDYADSLGLTAWIGYGYTFYGDTVTTYTVANDDGTITRIEGMDDSTNVVIENYSSTGTLESTKTIKGSLSEFLGFYSGEKYNFLVYGQSNSGNSDSKEVIRVVKYSKSWKKLGTAKIKGINTSYPADSGSLRMTEIDGNLVIHTCREMYSGHQANLVLWIDQSDMTYTQKTSVYSSHSFNQYVQTDGEYVYFLNHGDAYPRALMISKTDDEGNLVEETEILEILGSTGNNFTGVTVGGFELSTDNCLTVGTSNDQDYSSDEVSTFIYDMDDEPKRNVFLIVTDKDLGTSTIKWITDYDESNSACVGETRLVKISDDVFMLMWEVYSSASSTTPKVKMVLVSGNGDILSSKVRLDVQLTDGQPVYNSSTGYVTWFASNGEKVKMYRVNPYRLTETAKSLTSATISLSKTSYTYNGKTKKPSVTVKINGKTLTKGTDYTVSYSSGRKSIGKYTVTIKGKGEYSGTVKKTFTIKPAKATISSVKTSSKKITVKWKKVSGSVTKYQVRYKVKGGSWKTVNVSSSKLSKTLTGLKSGKTYYVQVRAYKTVNGTKYYGSWSKKKTVKVT